MLNEVIYNEIMALDAVLNLVPELAYDVDECVRASNREAIQHQIDALVAAANCTSLLPFGDDVDNYYHITRQQAVDWLDGKTDTSPSQDWKTLIVRKK